MGEPRLVSELAYQAVKSGRGLDGIIIIVRKQEIGGAGRKAGIGSLRPAADPESKGLNMPAEARILQLTEDEQTAEPSARNAPAEGCGFVFEREVASSGLLNCSAGERPDRFQQSKRGSRA